MHPGFHVLERYQHAIVIGGIDSQAAVVVAVMVDATNLDLALGVDAFPPQAAQRSPLGKVPFQLCKSTRSASRTMSCKIAFQQQAKFAKEQIKLCKNEMRHKVLAQAAEANWGAAG